MFPVLFLLNVAASHWALDSYRVKMALELGAISPSFPTGQSQLTQNPWAGPWATHSVSCSSVQFPTLLPNRDLYKVYVCLCNDLKKKSALENSVFIKENHLWGMYKIVKKKKKTYKNLKKKNNHTPYSISPVKLFLWNFCVVK